MCVGELVPCFELSSEAAGDQDNEDVNEGPKEGSAEAEKCDEDSLPKAVALLVDKEAVTPQAECLEIASHRPLPNRQIVFTVLHIVSLKVRH